MGKLHDSAGQPARKTIAILTTQAQQSPPSDSDPFRLYRNLKSKNGSSHTNSKKTVPEDPTIPSTTVLIFPLRQANQVRERIKNTKIA